MTTAARPLALPSGHRVGPLRRVDDGRIVKDRIRLWKTGVRDLVTERWCALHTFRVRLTVE
jgi:hypothetical protein